MPPASAGDAARAAAIPTAQAITKRAGRISFKAAPPTMPLRQVAGHPIGRLDARVGCTKLTEAEDFGSSGGPAHPRTAGPFHEDPIGRQESKLAPGFDHLPSTFMHESVVLVADQEKVLPIARPTSRPVD